MDLTGHQSRLLLIAIVALAAFFRFYLITDIPPGLYPDEAMNGNNAVEALRSGEFKLFYPENNGREGLFINLQALAIALWGAAPWVLRLVSAIFGTLTVLGIYLAAWELLFSSQQKSGTAAPLAAIDRRAGTVPEPGEGERGGRLSSKSTLGILNVREDAAVPLLSAFFLATSFWHINFSRIGFRAIMLPCLAVFGMYWLLKALRTGKISSALAAGAAAGLGFSTYIGFRFMPFVLVVPILFALAAWWRQKQAEHCTPCIAALFLFAALVAALPLGMYFLQHPADFFGRSAQVSIFSAESPLREFVKSNALTIGMLFFRGDCNPRHNLSCEPQLFWPIGVLFAIGLILAIQATLRGSQKFQAPNTKLQTNHKSQAPNHKRFGIWNLARLPDGQEFGIPKPAAWTLLAWLLTMMLPATLTREGLPHALRAIGMIPPVMIIAGIGGVFLWRALTAYLASTAANRAPAASRGQIGRIQKELAVAAILFFIWLPVNAYRSYFIRFVYAPETAGAFSADLWETGQYLGKLPDDVQKFVIVNLSGEDIRGVPAPAQTVMFASDTFDGERRRERNVTYVRRIEDIRIDPAKSGIDNSAKIAIMPLHPNDRGLIAAIRERFPGLRAKVRGTAVVFEN
ncbi:MAG: hypothetical protein Q8R35_03135 [bacterium]|nr:hypothetical protein [bacterium]